MQQKVTKKSSVQNTGKCLVLSRTQVRSLEEKASEIWIYATQYKTEYGGEALYTVRANLHRGAEYHYLLHENSNSLGDILVLRKRYEDVISDPKQLQFRVMKWDWMLPHMGIAIYDPTIVDGRPKRKTSRKATIVFSDTNRYFQEDERFKNWAITGPTTNIIQQSFLDVWNNAVIM